MLLGSSTSGHDGSSEGGRINTDSLITALTIYGTALADRLRRSGYEGKLSVEPRVGDDGIWGLVVVYDGEQPPAVPERWHGRRVSAAKMAPPAPAPGRK